MIPSLFTAMAVTTVADAGWSVAANTFLLIVLAVVTIYKDRRAVADRQAIHTTAKETKDEVHELVGKVARDPSRRTRESDRRADEATQVIPYPPEDRNPQ